MNVLYIFDDNYADVSGVSIYSLFSTNEKEEKIVLYIVDGGISDENKTKLVSLANQFNREIHFIPFVDPDEKFGIKLDIANWCKTNYIRLFLEDILPDSVDRLLYIDSDTLIRSSLSNLYNMELCGKPIGAAYDCYPLPKYQLGFSEKEEYFSDGILVLDLPLLRKMKTFEDYKHFLNERKGKVAYLEQGTINYVMKNKITLFSPKYNLMTLSLVIRKCPNAYFQSGEPFYSEEEMFKAIENPTIVHLTGHGLYTRPWQKNSNHPYAKEWQSILERTPWWPTFTYRAINKKFPTFYKIIVDLLNCLMENKTIAVLITKNSKRMKKIKQYRVK